MKKKYAVHVVETEKFKDSFVEFTCSEDEALQFMEELKHHHVPACGGSISGRKGFADT